MKSYRVEIAIDVDAKNPRKAAEKAEELLMLPCARWVCDVYDGVNKYRVDLEDPDDKGHKVSD